MSESHWTNEETTLNDLLVNVHGFHCAAGQPGPAINPTPETIALRVKLIQEELNELCLACQYDPNDHISQGRIGFGYRPEVLDAITDLLYVLIGTAIAFHLAGNLAEAFRRVHVANMAKFGPGGYRREDGKWIKPADWQKPDLFPLT